MLRSASVKFRTDRNQVCAEIPGGHFDGGRETTASDVSLQLPPIVFAIDDRDALPLCIALRSLAASMAPFIEQLRVFVLYEELSASTYQAIQRVVTEMRLSLRMTQIPDGMPNQAPSRWPATTYLRLAIPSLLPDERYAKLLHYAGPKPWLPDFPQSFALDVYRSFQDAGDPLSLAGDESTHRKQ